MVIVANTEIVRMGVGGEFAALRIIKPWGRVIWLQR